MPHPCAFFAQGWDSTTADRMRFLPWRVGFLPHSVILSGVVGREASDNAVEGPLHLAHLQEIWRGILTKLRAPHPCAFLRKDGIPSPPTA